MEGEGQGLHEGCTPCIGCTYDSYGMRCIAWRYWIAAAPRGSCFRLLMQGMRGILPGLDAAHDLAFPGQGRGLPTSRDSEVRPFKSRSPMLPPQVGSRVATEE